MTDVVVRRLKRQTVASGSEGSAALVLPDGCRNPAYRVPYKFVTILNKIKKSADFDEQLTGYCDPASATGLALVAP